MRVLFNYLWSKSYNSILLKLVSEDLSSSFVWNIFTWFSIFLDSLCWCLCIRQSRRLFQSSWTNFVQKKTLTNNPGQRFWGLLPTLSFSREKQAAVVLVCSLSAEMVGKLWHPPAQATVSILPLSARPCWVCLSFKTGKTDVSSLSSLGEVKAMDTWVNAFPSQSEAECWDFCLLTLHWSEGRSIVSTSLCHCLCPHSVS